jgi:peptidoglycan hydrolase CwlO-like protein
MKNLLTLLTLLISVTLFAQVTPEIKYPKFEIDSLGQKVVVMTIPQAMKLNNSSDLLEKFEKLSIEMKEYETLCVKVISEKDEAIAKLNITVGKLEGQLVIKDGKITDLQGEILSWMQRNQVLESQLANQKEQIDIKDKQIGKMKTKMWVGGSLGTLAIVGLVLISVGIIH